MAIWHPLTLNEVDMIVTYSILTSWEHCHLCLSVTNKNVTMSQDNVVAEAQPLCTGAELDLGDKRFWSYKKRIALLLCQTRGGISRIVSHPGRVWWGVLWKWLKGGFAAKDQSLLRACILLIWPQSVLRWAMVVPKVRPSFWNDDSFGRKSQRYCSVYLCLGAAQGPALFQGVNLAHNFKKWHFHS